MRRASALLLVAVLAAVGCGGAKKRPNPAGGATVAPASAVLFVRGDTTFNSPQWQTVATLGRLLPGAPAAAPPVAELKGALGPESDLVALTTDDLDHGTVITLTQPQDAARLDTFLAKQRPRPVFEEVGDWRVIADGRPTIDRFKRARTRGTLAASEAYREATDGLPAAALARFYLDGAAATHVLDRRAKTGTGPVPGLGRIGWVAGAATARRDGLDVALRVKGDEIEAEQFTAELPGEVPTPVSLFVDAKGLDATLDELKRSPALPAQLGPVAKLLGSGLLDDAIALFRGEAAFYVRPLPAGPEYTLVAKVEDDAGAKETLDRLATLAGALGQELPEHLTVEGVPVTKIVFRKTTLYYAVVDGTAVVSSAPSGVRGLVRMGTRLAESAAWKAAAGAAALPEQTAGIAYADVPRVLPLLRTLAGPRAAAGLRPLRTVMLYASVEESVLSVQGFVGASGSLQRHGSQDVPVHV